MATLARVGMRSMRSAAGRHRRCTGNSGMPSKITPRWPTRWQPVSSQDDRGAKVIEPPSICAANLFARPVHDGGATLLADIHGIALAGTQQVLDPAAKKIGGKLHLNCSSRNRCQRAAACIHEPYAARTPMLCSEGSRGAVGQCAAGIGPARQHKGEVVARIDGNRRDSRR